MVENRVGLVSASARQLLMAASLTLALLGSASAASAASTTSRSDGPVAADAGMRLVDFDAKVARAHGFEVVTLPDGSRASVPAARAEAARTGEYVPQSGVLKKAETSGGPSANAYGEAVGECGVSWVGIDPIGGSRATLTTGMSLVPDSGGPWDVHWHVDISDTAGNSTQNYDEYDGIMSGFGWSAYARRLSLTRGWANATVTWGSFTITEAGWVCYSYSPTASTTIT